MGASGSFAVRTGRPATSSCSWALAANETARSKIAAIVCKELFKLGQLKECRNIINKLQTACLQTKQGEGRPSQFGLIVQICADFRQSEPNAGKWTTLIRGFNPALGDLNARTIDNCSSGRSVGQYPLHHLNHRLTP